jgi:hypothetical protein
MIGYVLHMLADALVLGLFLATGLFLVALAMGAI